ncbi:hypothetical protein SB18R_13140 [Pseudomonas oryzihabitans]|nr:hypothetical protein NS201_21800 [Pseudomonas psychrotolerans]KTT36989.1 hypothetical protein SB9_03570 [Pseudomonas psychrotolerans]KTT75596.1 hypothetical protein SB18R_13140 [Pseudomonas psychrotolerans]
MSLWQRLVELLLREHRARQDELARVENPELLKAEWRVQRRRLTLWLASAALGAGLFGMIIGQLVYQRNHPDPWSAEARRPVILNVETHQDPSRFELLITADRSLFYERYRPDGALSLRLPRARWDGGERQGRVVRPGGSFSWTVRQDGQDLKVLLVGVGGALQASDRLVEEGENWVLHVEVPLAP